MNGPSAPYAPAVDVTITSAFFALRRRYGVLHVVAAERRILVRLLVDDLAAELREADLERLDDVLEVDDHAVGGE